MKEWTIEEIEKHIEGLAMYPTHLHSKSREIIRSLIEQLKEKEREVAREWKPASEPPNDDRIVLIFWPNRRHTETDISLGNYCHKLGYWRPQSTNGNFNDEIECWMDLPELPDEKTRRKHGV